MLQRRSSLSFTAGTVGTDLPMSHHCHGSLLYPVIVCLFYTNLEKPAINIFTVLIKIDSSKLLVGVNVSVDGCLFLCEPCDQLTTCPG